MTEERLVRDPDPHDPEDRYILVTPVPSFSHGLLMMIFNLDVTSADASLLSLTKKSAFSNLNGEKIAFFERKAIFLSRSDS